MSQSQACCSRPPVSADYTPKGTYSEVAGLKTYVVGPEDAKKAILMVYDVFGFSPQILQGADILATGGFRVAMPDFLKGSYATPQMFDGSEEGKKLMTEYFSGFPAKPDTQDAAIAKALAELKQKHGAVGTVGYCWGWKATMDCKSHNNFAAIATCHPSFLAATDGEGIDVPLCLLPSKDEDRAASQQVYDTVEKKNPGKNFLKFFDNDVHGWAAARGDLSGGPHTEAFQDAYQELLNFFGKYVK